MNKAEELVRQFLPTKKVMQLATSAGDQPWVCTVHFYADEQLNFYWASTPERRHSQEIKQNPKVAMTVMIHENTPAEDYVIGLSAEGTAEMIDKIDRPIAEAYNKQHKNSQEFLEAVLAGTNPHRFYKLTPTRFVLFDNKNFAGDPRQEWRP